MPHATDEELVRRFQQGDRRAFETFVRRHQDRVFRLAKAMLRSPDNAADAAQEVFLRAYTGLPRFRFRATPFTWLYRTLRNVCNETNRRERAPLEAGNPDSAESPLRAFEAERRLERALARIAELPERQRDVLLLRIFEGMSVEDTATTLGCRPGTVKAHLHAALTRLRERDPDARDDDAEGAT